MNNQEALETILRIASKICDQTNDEEVISEVVKPLHQVAKKLHQKGFHKVAQQMQQQPVQQMGSDGSAQPTMDDVAGISSGAANAAQNQMQNKVEQRVEIGRTKITVKMDIVGPPNADLLQQVVNDLPNKLDAMYKEQELKFNILGNEKINVA